jgi:hypothetical protein
MTKVVLLCYVHFGRFFTSSSGHPVDNVLFCFPKKILDEREKMCQRQIAQGANSWFYFVFGFLDATFFRRSPKCGRHNVKIVNVNIEKRC